MIFIQRLHKWNSLKMMLSPISVRSLSLSPPLSLFFFSRSFYPSRFLSLKNKISIRSIMFRWGSICVGPNIISGNTRILEGPLTLSLSLTRTQCLFQSHLDFKTVHFDNQTERYILFRIPKNNTFFIFYGS